jgi:hypothetical protein
MTVMRSRAAPARVGWTQRSVRITEPDGRIAFACDDVAGPADWSNLAVAKRRSIATGCSMASAHGVFD